MNEAVLELLVNKPNSTVKVLTNDSVALTTFAQTVVIFRDLVKDLTGNRITLIDVNMRNPPIAHAIDRVLIPVFNL